MIVTGGSKGLGKVIAQRFLSLGANVLICARNEPAESVEFEGRAALFVAADVRKPEQVDAVVDRANEEFGSVDVLVNNAGGAPPAESATASPSFNEKVIALNLIAPITFSQSAYRYMRTQDHGGVIINISSVSGLRANPMGVAYGAAKAGLNNVSQSLAAEWGPKVRVLTVTSGLIVTEQAHLFYGDQDGIDAVGRTLLLERMGDPAEVADVVLFAASPLARWMTGTNIRVDGGDEKPAYLLASTGEVTRDTDVKS